MTTVLRVAVPVATVWTSPDAPRDLDAAAVGDRPDVDGWLAGLSAADRLGLHGRTLTQLLADEPVLVVEEADDWVRVAAPWQPVPGQDGYLGWVPRGQLREPRDDDPDHAAAHVPADRIAVAGLRRAVRRPGLPLGRHQPGRLRLLGPGALLLPPGGRRGAAGLPRPGPRGRADPARRGGARRPLLLRPRGRPDLPRRLRHRPGTDACTRPRATAAAGSWTRSSATSAGGTWSPSAGSRSR